MLTCQTHETEGPKKLLLFISYRMYLLSIELDKPVSRLRDIKMKRENPLPPSYLPISRQSVPRLKNEQWFVNADAMRFLAVLDRLPCLRNSLLKKLPKPFHPQEKNRSSILRIGCYTSQCRLITLTPALPPSNLALVASACASRRHDHSDWLKTARPNQMVREASNDRFGVNNDRWTNDKRLGGRL